MKTASDYFTEEDKQTIANAVAGAEKKTSGEIVPVAATASGRYDRAEDIFGLMTALVVLTVAWVLFQDVVPAKGDWAYGATTKLTLPIVLLILFISFLVGAVLATWFPSLSMMFVTKTEMEDEVERRAAEAFQQFRIRGTRGSTGILIYVSLRERMVRILGDDAISSKLDQAAWEEICSLITSGLKDGKAAEGFVNAINKSGELLAGHFPIEPGDEDELSNELRLID